MWFTPPKLPPLALKLKSLEGGGRSPAKFYGETEDGRPVYVRYRGGWIQLYQGEIGASQDDPMQEMFAAKIGPPIDGAMVAEQACEILGLQVPGMRPVSHDVLMEGRRIEPVSDLSGNTTFWDAFIYTTKDGLPDVLSGLPTLGRPLVLFEHGRHHRYNQIATLSASESGYVYFGFDPIPGAIEAMNGPYDPDYRQELFSALLYVRSIRFSPQTQLGPDYGFERSDARWVHFSLSCPTVPSPQRKAAEEVVEAIRSCVGTQVDLIDVKTRAVVRQQEVWYSRDVRDWCLAEPNRIIGFQSDDKFVGWAMRPAGT